jgi:60 kDa SS-A/Ro ribonucleoprotein
MMEALKMKNVYDAFVIYTDNETWAGRIHPVEALAEYRREKNPEAKLVVVGMTSTRFTIADPKDSGMMDVVGFDASAPSVISNFLR